MCFADHLNYLLLIFCPIRFNLSLLFHFFTAECMQFKNLLFIKDDSNPKHFSFFVIYFNVPNEVSFTSPRLIDFQEFSTPPLRLFKLPHLLNFVYPLFISDSRVPLLIIKPRAFPRKFIFSLGHCR